MSLDFRLPGDDSKRYFFEFSDLPDYRFRHHQSSAICNIQSRRSLTPSPVARSLHL